MPAGIIALIMGVVGAVMGVRLLLPNFISGGYRWLTMRLCREWVCIFGIGETYSSSRWLALPQSAGSVEVHFALDIESLRRLGDTFGLGVRCMSAWIRCFAIQFRATYTGIGSIRSRTLHI